MLAILRGGRLLDQAALDRVPHLDDAVLDASLRPEPEHPPDLLAGDRHVSHVLPEAELARLDPDSGHVLPDQIDEVQLGVVPVRSRDTVTGVSLSAMP